MTLWTPAEITTALWLDASDSGTITLDGSSNVEQWDDKSGNANHAVQTTSGDRPSFVTSGLNSLGALSFSGSDEHLICPRILSDPEFMCFIVLLGPAQENKWILTQHTGDASTNRVVFAGSDPVTPFSDLYCFFNNGSSYSLRSTTTVFDSAAHICFTGSTPTGDWSMRVDGGSIEASVASQTNNHLNTSFQIGGHSFSPPRTLNGKIAEVVVVAGFSDSNRQKIEGYLAWKWGLEANLPVGHPYESAAPAPSVLGSTEITIATDADSDLQIGIDVPEAISQIVASDPTIFIGQFVVAPEMTIPVVADTPDIGLSIESHEATIATGIDSDVSIKIIPTEATIPMTVTEPSLFVGIFIESPEITSPITADGDVSIGIVPPESQILTGVDNPNINIVIMPAEAISAINADGSSVITFSMEGLVIRYLCVLTGAADGTTDLTLPMASFQARRRSGDPTYLSVVVPTVDYADAIAARPNGKLKIQQAYERNGEILQTETIMETSLDEVNPDEGGTNQSTTLVGYSTSTYSAKAVTLSGVTYRSTRGGKYHYRLAKPYIFLNPGDTVTFSDDGVTFVIDTMVYFINPTASIIELEST